MYLNFLKNHVLANLTFILVLVIGVVSYMTMPRQQDPDINFNWIIVTTVMPGASAQDIEKKITDPLEESLYGLSDVNFISSNSREGISSMLVRFNQIDERTYDKRLADLRRNIENTKSALPDSALDPFILEIISANAFPTAMVVVTGTANDENLRLQSHNLIKDLKQIKGVDRIDTFGQNDPEFHIQFIPENLIKYGVNPSEIADTVRALFQDLSAGKHEVNNENWLIRISGTDENPEFINDLPVLSQLGYIPLSYLAKIETARKDATELVSMNREPAVLLSVMKQSGANTLELIERVQDFVQSRNELITNTGVKLTLINDQSEITKKAIKIMETNALYGLGFVLLITFLFLGFKISSITTIGIPFILAGTFWLLAGLGQTLNVSILLGVVIALGMLVDDAVVVAESIYHKIHLGFEKHEATIQALKEVVAPVTTAVLTTIAAFLPLMLLPGILGEFMRVIPMVVTTALLISLVEAYWMLPAHILTMRFKVPKKLSEDWRQSFNHQIRLKYTRVLLKVLRFPKLTLLFILLVFSFAIFSLASGKIKMDFFASDTIRLFYINIEMEPGTTLEKSLIKAEEIEQKTRELLEDREYREIASYSGAMFTETEPLVGNKYAQVLVGLHPREGDMRTVEQILEDIREPITTTPGTENIAFLKLSGGPPVTKPISVKVRGDNYDEIRQATDDIIRYLETVESVSDISDDANIGSPQLTIQLDQLKIKQLNLNPVDIQRTIQLIIDGEQVSSLQKNGEKTNVIVRSAKQSSDSLQDLLDQVYFTANGDAIALSSLIKYELKPSIGNIRHYNFKRTITLEADIDKTQIDEVQANNLVKDHWKTIQSRYPNVDLDFSGILDDINESLNSIFVLFIFGVGMMYMILGTQFKSYFQPLLILTTVPLAFTGVIIGVLITGHPMSLYTLYGVVALAGIAVNSAIVLISTANAKLMNGMSLKHATIYASRRRVIPILITTLTTIGGLLSLALGLGGESLIWGPVANAIVWGLGVSSTLTLFLVPTLYMIFMSRSHLNHNNHPSETELKTV